MIRARCEVAVVAVDTAALLSDQPSCAILDVDVFNILWHTSDPKNRSLTGDVSVITCHVNKVRSCMKSVQRILTLACPRATSENNKASTSLLFSSKLLTTFRCNKAAMPATKLMMPAMAENVNNPQPQHTGKLYYKNAWNFCVVQQKMIAIMIPTFVGHNSWIHLLLLINKH